MATTVVVGSVYPPGFDASITGQVICGDGSVCLGVAGGQFGSTAVVVIPPQFVSVGGVDSAQAFGGTTARLPQVVPVQGLWPVSGWSPSISITGQVICGDGHLCDGSQPPGLFGQVGVVAGPVAVPVTGLGSAQAFGAPTIYLLFTVRAVGLPSAQAFGAIGIRAGPVFIPVLGLASAGSFGLLLVYVVYLRPTPCRDVVLDGATCSELVLTPSAPRTIILTEAA